MTVDTTFLPKTNGMVFGDRLQARADKGRVFLMADVTPPPAALTIVSNAVLSGDPYVGSTITCADPVVSGGLEPYSFDYMWLDAKTRSAINNTTLLEFDLGKSVSCYVTVVSADGQTIHTTSNSVGPVTYAPTNATLTEALPNTYDVTPFQRHSLQVRATGVHTLSYFWQIRNAADDAWVTANPANLADEYPAAETVVWEVNRDGEPMMSTFMFNFVTGPGPTKMRVRIRDTDPAGNFDQVLSTTTLNYV